MKRDTISLVAAVLAVVFVAALALPWQSEAQTALVRISSEYKRWDSSEARTDAPYFDYFGYFGGISIYEKTIFVPRSVNTLYITMEATGDGHSGQGHHFQCAVNGVPCNPGSAGGSFNGGIVLQRHAGERGFSDFSYFYYLDADDLHDNSISYSWCAPVTTGTRTVTIRMANDSSCCGDVKVFLEGMHVFIDGNQLPTANRCTQAPLTSEEQPD
jgi:hypothetical protein